MIALVGPFDEPSLSVQLARRVIEAELHDRCPDVEVRVFAPTAGSAGLDPVEALGTPDAGRVAAFTATRWALRRTRNALCVPLNSTKKA